jgi:hypothetical protein
MQVGAKMTSETKKADIRQLFGVIADDLGGLLR